MCITLWYGKPFPVLKDSKGRLYGWKVFRQTQSGKLYGEYCGTNTVRPRGKWLKVDDYSPLPEEMESAARIYNYIAGWHVFTKRREAIRYGGANSYNRIVKVLVRKVRERGTIMLIHAQLKCFVVDEIFIPEKDARLKRKDVISTEV